MTSRERVGLAINHRAPDRVPIDLGGTACSMTEDAYWRLKEFLRLEKDHEEVTSVRIG